MLYRLFPRIVGAHASATFLVAAASAALLLSACKEEVVVVDSTPPEILTIMHLIVPTVCLAAAMAVGAVYSWIAGFLKVKLNVNVLISTIILNAIAVRLVGYLVNFPMRADFNNIARTRRSGSAVTEASSAA